MSRLDRLDDAVVPVLAAALRRGLDALQDRVGAPLSRRVVRARRPTGSATVEPARARPVRPQPGGPEQSVSATAHTGRWRRPLATMREVPQLAMLLAVVVFVVGVLTVLEHRAPRPAARDQRTTAGPGVGLVQPTGVGPSIGELAETYVSDAHRSTLRQATAAPDSLQIALVGLSTYLSPEQVVALVGPMAVQRVLLRPPVATGTAGVVDTPVSQVLADLKSLFARTVVHKRVDAKDLRSTGDSIVPGTQEEADFKAFYATALATANQEIALYQNDCPCVFMLLVRGKASELQALERQPAVRVVQFAPTGVTVGQLVVTPLLPGAAGPVAVLQRSAGGAS